MSDSAHAPTHTSGTAAAGQVVSTPEFDAREVELFGEKDGQAVRAIGKMLTVFFFYSLIVMSAVGYWTMTRGGQAKPHVPGAHHDVDHADEE